MTRPAFGGNLMATIICPHHRPQMATVRHKVMKQAVRDESRNGEVVLVSSSSTGAVERTKVIDIIKEMESTVNITEADIIVSGGRGMQKPENFSLIKDLAEALGKRAGPAHDPRKWLKAA